MTQFQDTYSDPNGVLPVQAKTSGLAISALVVSILGIIPCCGLIIGPSGALLGIIAIPVIGSDQSRRGKGLAVAAIIIGVLFAMVQGWGLKYAWEKFWVPVMEGPEPALTAGFAGDISGFKAAMTGGAASASDEEIQLFLDSLEDRYGKYSSCRFDENRQQQNQQVGQPEVDFNYLVEFENDTVQVRARMVFYDEKTDKMPLRPRMIEVIDPDLGNLTFPAQKEN